MYRDDSYLMHHGVKGMHWGVRRFRNYDGTLTAAGKAQRKAQGSGGSSRSGGGRGGMSSTTKRRLATAAKVAGAAAAVGGAAYLANRAVKRGKVPRLPAEAGSAPAGVKMLPAAKGAMGNAREKAGNFRESAKTKASNFRESAKAKASSVRDTLDNASRGIDDGTRLGRAASSVGAAGRRVTNVASGIKGKASDSIQGMKDRAAIRKAQKYREKYGVSGLAGPKESLRTRVGRKVETAGRYVDAAGQVAGVGVKAARRGVRGVSSVAQNAAGDAIRGAARKAKNTASGIKGKASDSIQGMKDRASVRKAQKYREKYGVSGLAGPKESLRTRAGRKVETAARYVDAAGQVAGVGVKAARRGVRGVSSVAQNAAGDAIRGAARKAKNATNVVGNAYTAARKKTGRKSSSGKTDYVSELVKASREDSARASQRRRRR